MLRTLLTSLALIAGIFLITTFFILSFDEKNVVILAIILTLFAFSGFVPGIFYLYEDYNNLSVLELSLAALFAAFFFSANYFAMLIPSIVYYVLPGGAGFTFYFPVSIFYGAYKSLSKVKGNSLLLLASYGIISELFFPALFWLPYYLAWGGFTEIHANNINYSRRLDTFLHGFIFGIYGAGLSLNYMLLAWGYYRPIFLSLPAIIIDGLLASIGFNMGYKIGKKLGAIQL